MQYENGLVAILTHAFAEWHDKVDVDIKLSEQKNSKLFPTFEADYREDRNKDY